MLNIKSWSDRKEMESCIRSNSRLGDLGVMPSVAWENKISRAIFRGAQTGDLITPSGNHVGRGKLMDLSLQNEDVLEVWFTKLEEEHLNYTKTMPNRKNWEFRRPLCEDLDYKYAIAIDGNVAGF